MALPIIKNASFSIKIKEFSKPIKIRPMILAEHKAIQAATDMNDDTDIATVIADVTASCTDNIISATSVPAYVLNFVFLQLYMNSVENIVQSRYTCYNIKKDEDGKNLIDEETGDEIKCNTSIDVNIPLSKAQIEYPENFEDLKTVKITEDIYLVLKCLSLQQNIEIQNLQYDIVNIIQNVNSLESINDETSAEDKKIYDDKIDHAAKEIQVIKNKIKDCYSYFSVDYIQDGQTKLFPEKDFNHDEFIEWMNNCPSSSLLHSEKFYEKTPEITMDLEVKCDECGNKESIKLRGLKDFFS